MDQLPLEFTEKGFTYKQLRRNEAAAIYRQVWGKNGSPAYEVVIPQIGTKQRIDGEWQKVAPYEHYPTARQWGLQGWTLTTEQRANQKFNEVTEKARSSMCQTHRNRSNEVEAQ